MREVAGLRPVWGTEMAYPVGPLPRKHAKLGALPGILKGGCCMERDLQTAVEAFVERFGNTAMTEAVSRYRDSILEDKAQQALAWRSIADAIDNLRDSQALRAIN